jgi:CRP-like cAMP-binding protein
VFLQIQRTHSRLTDIGRLVLVNIHQTDAFFGESALLHLSQRPEGAMALENTKLMAWSASEVEELIRRQPRLGIAFAQCWRGARQSSRGESGASAATTLPGVLHVV